MAARAIAAAAGPAIAVTLWGSGCGDPVRDQAIAALGPESPNRPAGPLHRANQPCLLCHSDAGGSVPMTVAGTVFRDPIDAWPVADVEVLLVDAAGRGFSTRTNCAGNFFVYPRQWAPTFPVWVTVRHGRQSIDMESPLNKDGDCATCHQDPKRASAVGHVFLDDNPERWAAIPAATCGP
jgi:hypothetical protein